jgi:hypothetical protein
MKLRLVGMAGVALATFAAVPATASSSAVKAAPANLAFSPPAKLPAWAGGEPSLAFDPSGNGAVYVTAPQSIPALLNGPLGGTGGSKGVGLWRSPDGGHTWPTNANVGSAVGGGDSDVEVGADHTVYVADLEAVGAAICTSSDGGKTFRSGPGGCDGLPFDQAGPENDRQWLSRGADGSIYLTYHDFAAGFPLIMRSTDHAATFQPCGSILDPTSSAGQNYTPAGGTLVAKPAVGGDGTVYVEVTEPDRIAPPVGATLNHLFIATAKGCGPTTVWRDHQIYTDPGADLGKIFNAVAVDRGGVLYVVAAGHTKAGQQTTGIWLFTSHDHGVTWSKPLIVNPPALTANVLPAIVGGLAGGQVAIGWFGTSTSGDPNGLMNQWRYYVATSRDAGQTFAYATVTPDVIHHGDICTQGIFCGLIPNQPGNRNLADFSSIAIDPSSGCLLVALPGDPQNRPDLPNGANDFSSSTFISRQTGGPCFRTRS